MFFIIFCSKISIWFLNNFPILYIIYYLAENFCLSIHFTVFVLIYWNIFTKCCFKVFLKCNICCPKFDSVGDLFPWVIFLSTFYANQFWIVRFSFWTVWDDMLFNPIEYVGIFVILTENQPSQLIKTLNSVGHGFSWIVTFESLQDYSELSHLCHDHCLIWDLGNSLAHDSVSNVYAFCLDQIHISTS